MMHNNIKNKENIDMMIITIFKIILPPQYI